MIREYVIFEACWNENKREVRVNNLRQYFGKNAIVNSSSQVEGIEWFINHQKSQLSLNQNKVINSEFILVKEAGVFNVFFFAYEDHLSESLIIKDIEIQLNSYYGPAPYVAPHRMVAFKPTNVDPATMRLMQSALPMHGCGDKCPKCGDAGYKVRTALMCSKGHGIISGF